MQDHEVICVSHHFERTLSSGSARAQDGFEAGRIPGGGKAARLELPAAALTLPAGLRVFPAVALPGREFTITDPPNTTLMITA